MIQLCRIAFGGGDFFLPVHAALITAKEIRTTAHWWVKIDNLLWLHSLPSFPPPNSPLAQLLTVKCLEIKLKLLQYLSLTPHKDGHGLINTYFYKCFYFAMYIWEIFNKMLLPTFCYFWHFEQICKLEQITAHIQYQLRISNPLCQANCLIHTKPCSQASLASPHLTFYLLWPECKGKLWKQWHSYFGLELFNACLPMQTLLLCSEITHVQEYLIGRNQSVFRNEFKKQSYLLSFS